MLGLVALALLGACLPLSLAYPAIPVPPGPQKYVACKRNDCPSFRVVQKIADDVEEREYPRVWWASAKAQALVISRNVTTPLYWRLRRYIQKGNKQLQAQNSVCNNEACQKGQWLKMGVPVTRLIESTTTRMKDVTISFYLSVLGRPPRPTDNRVWLEYKPLRVYVRIFKGKPFYTRLEQSHAQVLAKDLTRLGVDGTAFYPPSAKYMVAGYDSPFVPTKLRTNEVWLIKKPASTT